MKTSLIILPLLFLAGCGSSRPTTHTQWKSDHQYAKETFAVPAHPQSPESVGVYQYTDNIPRITAAGVYSVEAREYTLTVDQTGNVLAEVRK